MNGETLAPVSAKTTFGLSRNMLKYIAIIAMAIDHSAHVFVPSDTALYVIMRLIGRITGPVMFFAAVEGYHHTRNINRYMARLALFAVISYFPFIFFLSGGSIENLVFYRMNVIYTIFLGVAAIRIRHEIHNPFLKTALILSLCVLSLIGDWGVIGLLLILAFDYYYGNFKHQAFAACIIIIMNSDLIYATPRFILGLFDAHYAGAVSLSSFIGTLVDQARLLPILLLRFYNGQPGRGGAVAKWLFYIFYPLHLLILGLIIFIWGQ